MRILTGLIVLLGGLFFAGCASNPIQPANPSIINSSQPATQAIVTPDRLDVTKAKIPERVPTTEAMTPVTGEVPSEILDSIRMDLVKRTGAALETISIIQAQSIVWNDGSLGCAQPGVMYTQAPVNGYWVILDTGGRKYDYRASETGYLFLCKRALPPASPPGTPKF
jgi:hypothetical protein